MNKKDVWLVVFALLIVFGLTVFVLFEPISSQQGSVDSIKSTETSEAKSNKEGSQSAVKPSHSAMAASPGACFKNEIDNVTRSMNALKRDKSAKYSFYRQLFKKEKVGEAELVARLVYAETLASRCHSSLHRELYQMIFYVIKNRIIKKGGIVEAAIWQFNQFASSLHNYEGSMISEFLCPTQKELWQSILAFVEGNIVIENTADDLLVPKDGYNYFLFQHRPEPVKFSKGHWATTFPVFKEIKYSGKVCARFYRNRHYR